MIYFSLIFGDDHSFVIDFGDKCYFQTHGIENGFHILFGFIGNNTDGRTNRTHSNEFESGLT